MVRLGSVLITPARAALVQSNLSHTSGTTGRQENLSPQLRGTRRLVEEGAPWRRFIPACAGNACLFTKHFATTTVHPRTHGEHRSAALAAGQKDGSSPRVRGTLDRSPADALQARFIPARAGNANRPTPQPHEGTVHPRTRGEPSSHNPLIPFTSPPFEGLTNL